MEFQKDLQIGHFVEEIFHYGSKINYIRWILGQL